MVGRVFQKPPGSIAQRTSSSSWGGFCVWALLGAATAFGLLIAGSFAVLPILLGVWLAAIRPALRRSWFGVMTGFGATLLFVAYGERRGPGLVCSHTVSSISCRGYSSPWPWLVVGAVLVLVGFIAHAWRLGSRS